MKKLIIAALITVAAIPSFAWGDREQGALLGLIIGGVIAQQQQQPVYVTPQPVYVTPQPVYVAPPVYAVPPYVPPPTVQYDYRPHPYYNVCGVDVVCEQPRRVCRSEAVFNHHGRFIGYRTICE
jgi:hypothetical protein